jgi:hypothetical protein
MNHVWAGISVALAAVMVAGALVLRRGTARGKTPAIPMDAIVAKPGDVVVLRPPQRLTPEQRDLVRAYLERLDESGVRFAVFEAEWQPVVIGGRE